MNQQNYPAEWSEAVMGYLAVVLDKAADYNSTICTWHNSGEKIGHTFARFALPITWDFAELPRQEVLMPHNLIGSLSTLSMH